jgi:hypothetical protein
MVDLVGYGDDDDDGLDTKDMTTDGQRTGTG